MEVSSGGYPVRITITQRGFVARIARTTTYPSLSLSIFRSESNRSNSLLVISCKASVTVCSYGYLKAISSQNDTEHFSNARFIVNEEKAFGIIHLHHLEARGGVLILPN